MTGITEYSTVCGLGKEQQSRDRKRKVIDCHNIITCITEANEKGTTVLAKQSEISISHDYGEGIWRNSEEVSHHFHIYKKAPSTSDGVMQLPIMYCIFF